MTYSRCKKIIAKGNYDKEKMLNDLDLFLLGNRITNEEYKELVEAINA